MATKLKEEFNAARHAEFQVDPETDKKHRVFSLLTLTGTDSDQAITDALELYDVTQEDVDLYKFEFQNLKQ